MAEASRIAHTSSVGGEAAPSLPARAYTPDVAPDSAGQAVVVLRAAYTDRGANGARAASGENMVVLRAPTVVVARGELADGVQKYKGPEVPVEVAIGSRSGAFVGFKQLDLRGISARVLATAPCRSSMPPGGRVRSASTSPRPLSAETGEHSAPVRGGAPAQLGRAQAHTVTRDVYSSSNYPAPPAEPSSVTHLRGGAR